jgi:imidazolonepropionase
MRILFRHIKSLIGIGQPAAPLRGAGLANLPQLHNAWLLIEGERIVAFGAETGLSEGDLSQGDLLQADLPPADRIINCEGRYILPAFCDSHTHMVFAGSRESEFVDKIRGLSYAEIAAKGGGIHSSARRLAATPFEQLFRESLKKLEKITASGTGAIEIKSGYGLTVDAELKMLSVIKALKQHSPVPIKATFLGAHAIPPEYASDREAYIRLIIDEMLPVIQQEQLADYIDVFCENGFFSPDETIRICEAGKKFGLIPKIHANQLHVSGGVQAGIAAGALSVDHLESMDQEAIDALAKSDTIGTLLPTAAYFLRMQPPPARALIEAGAAIALATDYNPGSSPAYRMSAVVSMACIQMKMVPEEAINAATINGAFAMGLEQKLGSIYPGKLANLIITEPIPSLAYLPYSFGESSIAQVYVKGLPVNSIR